MAKFDIWTSELSPFSIKTQACLEFAGHSFRRVPRDCGRVRALLIANRIRRAKAKGTILRYPEMSDLDEYPLVPILIESGGQLQFDSSAIAGWLDTLDSPRPKLWPQEPALKFVAQLIDEAFDEFCLYIAHHQRWSV